MLNNLNYIRYLEVFPEDDIKFIFREKVNASSIEARLEQKEEIMSKMLNF